MTDEAEKYLAAQLATVAGVDAPAEDMSALLVLYLRACERHNLDEEDETLTDFASEIMGVAYLLGRTMSAPIPTNAPGGDA